MDINFFYQKDENGNLALNEQGESILLTSPTDRPSVDDLRDSIRKGRPQKGIDAKALKVVDNLNWKHYDKWKEAQDKYEQDKANYNLALEAYQSKTAEEQAEISAPVEPTEPEALSFEPVTVDDVMNMVSDVVNQKTKEQKEAALANLTVEYNGNVFDADKDARSAIVQQVVLMKENNIELAPWKLANNTWVDISADDLNSVALIIAQKVVETMQSYEGV